jgi:drug/metabolite transporter (DMT)-like permease
MNVPLSSPTARAADAGPVLALVFLALLWGYNWVVMKVAMQYIGPMDFAAMRGVFGVVLLFGLLAVLGVSLKPKYVLQTVFLGVFQTTGFVGLISWALSIGAAGKSAVLGYTMPFWVIVFKKIPVESRNDLLSVTAWQMVFGMLPLVVIALLVDERPIVWSGYFIGALIYNGVGGMALATLLWLYILQRLPATISGLNALAVPIVGVIAAWIHLGERPSPAEGAGMLLILAGLALLTSTQRNVQP